ncbi:MAG: hypothetical protein NDJ89_09095 [Oligoflexia bacterium]|nr:hypothetical protein [Oligoflexia bacterium]
MVSPSPSPSYSPYPYPSASSSPYPYPTYSPTPAPSSLSEFTCYGIEVSGPSIPADPRFNCTNSADGISKLGGLVPVSGGVLEIEVPAGPARVVRVFALKNAIGCPSLDTYFSTPDEGGQDLGDPYLIAQATTDLFEDVELVLRAKYDPANPQRLFDSCESPHSPSSSPTPYPSYSPYPYPSYSPYPYPSYSPTPYPSPSYTPALYMIPDYNTLPVSSGVNIQVYNGVYPYTYSIVSGSGTLSPADYSVYFNASATAGDVTVRVTDSVGATFDTVLHVIIPMTLSAPNKIAVNRTAQITPSGGIPPYSFSIFSGGGSIDGSGNYTASLTPGMVEIEVWDTVGSYQKHYLSVYVPLLAVGQYHACAQTFAGVHCWGAGSQGQLGDGFAANSSYPSLVSGIPAEIHGLTAGQNHSCAMAAGGVYCWGENAYGQLGNGSNTNSSYGIEIIPMWNGVTAIDAGQFHTCMIQNGSAYCWGQGGSGRLGNNSGVDSSVPVQVQGLTSGVTAISAGGNHSCAVMNGGAYCWGLNTSGQLGTGTFTSSVIPVPVSGLSSGVKDISAGISHSCATLTDGSVKCWGANSYGQLGDGTTTMSLSPVAVSPATPSQFLSTGANSTCASTGSGVQCWGYNNAGQLGDGTTTDRSLPTSVTGLGSIFGLGAGAAYACALSDNQVMCWGDNLMGQLGKGDYTGTLTPMPVSGLSL